jgi:hypothetical protein
VSGGEGRVIIDVMSALLLGSILVVSAVVLVVSPATAASFVHGATTAGGHAIGFVIGNLPNLWDAVRKGIELCR